MRKPIILLLHLGYWLLYLLLLSIIFSIANMQIQRTELAGILSLFPLIMLFLVPNMLAFYTFYFLVFPVFLVHKKFLGLTVFGLIICAISALLGSLISLFIFGIYQPVFSDISEFLNLNVSLLFIAAIHGGIALVIHGFITWFDELKLKEVLAQKNYQTEIALVKSQINPHFLFNTINNIDVLISKNSAQASAYLNKLSDILRYMVYDTKNEKISLEKELNYIEKYLELQKIRTANPNYVSFEIVGETNNRQIAPMIFFPFLENAFKHTENNKNSNSINIKFSLDEKAINFECQNTYQKNVGNKQDYGGLGNELIKKRLELLYPEKNVLEVNNDEGIYQVKLTIYEN